MGTWIFSAKLCYLEAQCTSCCRSDSYVVGGRHIPEAKGASHAGACQTSPSAWPLGLAWFASLMINYNYKYRTFLSPVSRCSESLYLRGQGNSQMCSRLIRSEGDLGTPMPVVPTLGGSGNLRICNY